VIFDLHPAALLGLLYHIGLETLVSWLNDAGFCLVFNHEWRGYPGEAGLSHCSIAHGLNRLVQVHK